MSLSLNTTLPKPAQAPPHEVLALLPVVHRTVGEPPAEDGSAVQQLMQRPVAGKLTPLLARVLAARGFTPNDELRSYLQPDDSQLPTWQTLEKFPLLQGAFKRLYNLLCDAKERNQKVVLINDFDADGYTSAAVFSEALRQAGIKYEIYETRRSRGYGMHHSDVEPLFATGGSVFVALDLGTQNGPQLQALKDRCGLAGRAISTVVIDHHTTLHGDVPADVFINPARPGCELEQRRLCTATLAWLTMRLFKEKDDLINPFREIRLNELLDYAAIGGICDMMPMHKGATRIITQLGLSRLNQRFSPGLDALCEELKISGKITSFEVGMFIGACINAAGRMDIPNIVIELLTTRDAAKAKVLAREICGLNKERKLLLQNLVSDLASEISAWTAQYPEECSAMMVHHRGGDPRYIGVVGLIASIFAELTQRPSGASVEMGEFARGSARQGRTDVQLDKLYATEEVHRHVKSAGGHPAAGGHTVPAQKIAAFYADIEKAVRSITKGAPADSRVRPDLRVTLSELDYRNVMSLKRLDPFGPMNREPKFRIDGLYVLEVQRLRDFHLKITLVEPAQGAKGKPKRITAFLWRYPDHPVIKPGEYIDVVAHVGLGVFKNTSKLRLTLLAASPSQVPSNERPKIPRAIPGVWEQMQEGEDFSRSATRKPEITKGCQAPRKKRGGGRRRPKGGGQEQFGLQYSAPETSQNEKPRQKEGWEIEREPKEPTIADLAKKSEFEALNFEEFRESKERVRLLNCVVEEMYNLDPVNILLRAPTGSGKTYVALAAAAPYIATGQRVIFTTPQTELAHQILRDAGKLLKVDPKSMTWLTGDVSGSKRIDAYQDLSCKLIVATPQIIYNDLVRDQIVPLNFFSFVLCDELHHARGNDASRLVLIDAGNRGVRRMGLSASPAATQEDFFLLHESLGEFKFFDITGHGRIKNQEIFPVTLDGDFVTASQAMREYILKHNDLAFEVLERFPGFTSGLTKPSSKENALRSIPYTESVRGLLNSLTTLTTDNLDIKQGRFHIHDLYQGLMLNDRLSCYGRFAFLRMSSERLWNFRTAESRRAIWKGIAQSSELKTAYDTMAKDTSWLDLSFGSKGFERWHHMRRNLGDVAYENFIEVARRDLIKDSRADHPKAALMEQHIIGHLHANPYAKHMVFPKLAEVAKFQASRLSFLIEKEFGQKDAAVSFLGKKHVSSGERRRNLQKFREGDAVVICGTAMAEGHHLPAALFGHIYDPSAEPITFLQQMGRIGRGSTTGTMYRYWTRDTADQIKMCVGFHAAKKMKKVKGNTTKRSS